MHGGSNRPDMEWMHGQEGPDGTRDGRYVYASAPRNVYWEMTIACDLTCRHCRAEAIPQADPLQLNETEARAMLDDVRSMGSMIMFTGGDPMKRPDLYRLMEYARDTSLRFTITPAITPLLTQGDIERFKQLGCRAMGLSLDCPTAAAHDTMRGVPGTFDRTMIVLDWARKAGIPVQVNTTITRDTIRDVRALYDLLASRFSPPVFRWSLFLLVATGRGRELAEPSPEEIESLFGWVYETSGKAPFMVSTVEAPHYRAYWVRRKIAEGLSQEEIDRRSRMMGLGVRDGNGVVFVSHTGTVHPAGFLSVPVLGNVRDRKLSQIYRESPALLSLRDMDQLKGKCGRCDFKWMCGGSRARAYAATGDPMETDPACAYEPPASATH